MKEQDRQAALEFALTRTNKRLEIFKEHNSGIPEKDLMHDFAQNEGVYWEDLEPIINAAKRQLDQYGDNISVGEQAALDTFPDGMNYQGQYVWDWFTKNSETIRAALTAPDVNAELLERAKALVKYCEWQINEGTDHHPTLPSAIVSAKEAIARAKQKGGE